MKLRLLGLCACLALVLAPLTVFSSHDDECNQIVGFVSATQPNDPGFEGLWRYCLTVDFDRGDAVIDERGFQLVLPFDANCPCICHPDLIQFAEVVGQVSGDDDSDHNDGQCAYHGFYNCEGDTTLCVDGPSISFELAPNDDAQSDDDSSCDTDDIGRATFCFYSALPPGPFASHEVGSCDDSDDGDHDGGSHDDSSNDSDCTGYIVGRLPACDCSVPTLPATWGRIKNRFEE